MNTKEYWSSTRWRNQNNTVPMEPLTQLFWGCPRKIVNLRQVKEGSFPQITLMATGLLDFW